MNKRNILKGKKLVVANWKMNPSSLHDARKIFSDLKKKNIKGKKTINVLCPPNIYLGDLANNYSGTKFLFGAQDVSFKKETEATGETSTEILKSFGVHYVIVGHPERRAMGETNEIVAMKLKTAIDADMTPVLCVGEVERDRDGKYLSRIEEQIHLSLSKITKKDITKIVIAYEPVWTIGAGKKSIPSTEIHQMSLFVRKVLSKIYNRKDAMNVPILYGGSVDAENAQEIVDLGEVDGLLIGRASLNQFVFLDILKVLNK